MDSFNDLAEALLIEALLIEELMKVHEDDIRARSARRLPADTASHPVLSPADESE